MKKLLTLTFGLALAFTGNVWAQTDSESVSYNQYGVKVDREELISEQRNNILTFESKNKQYRLWMDNRVQVDGAMFFGKNHSEYDKIGNNASIRRARLAIKARLPHNWYGEVDMDLADGKFELKDAIIQFDGIPNVSIKAGNFKEDFSMDQTTT